METHREKRQKVTIACDACRRRKAKCDGNEPVCGPCQRRSNRDVAECTWSASSRLHTSNSHIRQLQDRIAELEDPERRHDSATTDRLTGTEPLSPDRDGHVEDLRRIHGSPESIRGADPTILPRRSVDLSQRSDPSPVYTVIGPTANEENSEGFFGSSTAGTFMQNVSIVVEQRLHGQSTSPSRFLLAPGNRRRQTSHSQHHLVELDDAEMSLPLRRTADELMRVYWEYFHPLFPVLDEQHVQAEYQCLWTGDDGIQDQKSLLCLINAAFAVSCQLNPSTPPQDRARVAAQYYDRAQNLLDVFQRRGSLQTVQALLLLSMYCQSSNNAHQCWIFIGLAVRIAQGLGLHRTDAIEYATETYTKDLLRRVWHACVFLDQIVASTCGRPCAIGARNSVIVPLPTIEDSVEPAAIIDFFNCSVKICRILHETIYALCSPVVSRVQSLDELYDHYFGHNPNDPSKPSVFDVEKDLKRWRESIPEYLKLETSCPMLNNNDTERQRVLHHRLAVALEQHYLHVRLLLLRPFISAVITFESTSPSTYSTAGTASLPWDISLQCAISGVKVAQDVVSLVSSQRSAQSALWWFNVLFVYTAGTVLIASLLSPSIGDGIPEASILESWHSAVEILDGYSAFGPSIKRLVTTLQVLFDTVPKHHSRRKQQRLHTQIPQQPASRSSNANTEREDDSRIARWRMSPSAAASGTLQGFDGDGAPEPEQHLEFSPLPAGLFDGLGDPFDLAWLTDLPLDLSF